jgi:cyclic pyranopterin phosphate synthase
MALQGGETNSLVGLTPPTKSLSGGPHIGAWQVTEEMTSMTDTTAMSSLTDTFGRPLRNLRLSVTDRCNLRCQYCMPEEEYVWLPREDLLTFEEIRTLVDIFAELGVDKIRLTGGEPLLRKDLPALVAMLADNLHINDLAMTTNGVLLGEQAQALYAAGLHRVTVSLDTLHPERFQRLTRRDSHAKVLHGIETVRKVGFQGLKIDTVVMRGTNDDELLDLIEYGKRVQGEVRFIEYMDVGGATHWSMDKVISRAEVLALLQHQYGPITPLMEMSSAPAERFALPDGTVFGIIASTTAPFCRTCDRSRLTADGMWFLCLYARKGIDLRTPLRGGASREEIKAIIQSGWSRRTDRGAEERQEVGARGVLVQIEGLRQDPHLEMHTRGG